MRVLELAGYVTTVIQFGAGGAGTPPSRWVVIDPGLMEASEEPTESAAPVAWPAGARFTVSLHLNVRRTATNRSLAMPGQPIGLMPFLPFWSAEGPNTLVFGSSQAVSSAVDLLTAIDSTEIAKFVEDSVMALGRRWRDQAVLGDLDPFSTVAAPGLLWIFDPRYWDLDPPTWVGPKADSARRAAEAALRAVDVNVEGFFRAQATAATRSDLREATLGGLLEIAVNGRGEARSMKRDYFSALENQFAWSVEQGLEGASLDLGTFHDVCGQAWLGHPSRLRWLDVILYLAESRLLPFPALMHPELSYDVQFEEEPTEVVMASDGQGVEIRVLYSEPIVVRREDPLPDERPVAECMAWEYTGADPQGIATLIVVAAPGVSVTGREHVGSSWRLVVYRVQDHDLVPAWGEHIQTSLFEASYDEGGLTIADAALFVDGDAVEGSGWDAEPGPTPPREPQSAFRVRPLPLGVHISYPAAKSEEDAWFTVDIAVDEESAAQAFSYGFELLEPGPGAYRTHNQPYELVVRATAGVRIKVRRDWDSEAYVIEHYQRANGLAGVDAPGVPLSWDPAEMALRGVTEMSEDEFFDRALWEGYQWVFLIGQIGVDVGVGMIPIVGDAVDVSEFILSFATGTDRWGSPVTNVDRAIMFGGMLIPFVSSGALRGVKTALGG